jgi:hypothetical protein
MQLAWCQADRSQSSVYLQDVGRLTAATGLPVMEKIIGSLIVQGFEIDNEAVRVIVNIHE